ncbi:MAG: hypothetical protein JXQ71_12390 [Verrucomicrobia bacterium]|nr:hypothetical protein [Verrucomicrobiota bacterium]
MNDRATSPRRRSVLSTRTPGRAHSALAAFPGLVGSKALAEIRVLIRLAREFKPRYSTR